MKNREGITLISLVVMVVIILILASIGTYSGMNVIKLSKLTAFTTELKIMQTQVNAIYEQYNGTKEYGEPIISGSIKEQADKVFTELKKDEEIDSSGYRYWSNQTIKDLGIEGVEQDFFVNLEKRSVVSCQGLEYEGKVYYTLSQLPNGLYNVEYTETKDTKEEPTFDVKIETIDSSKWRITVSNIQYTGYINKWQIRYKLEEEETWKETENLSFIVNQQGVYKIKIVNNEIESQEKEVIAIENYTKDGLVLHYDGINNMGEGDDKHSTTTTIWKDLSGYGNDAQLKNFDDNTNKWGDNCLQLDGINDYAEVADNTTISPTEQTIEIVFNRTGNTEHLGRGIIFVKWNGYTVELNPINSSNQFTVAYGRNNGYLNSNKMLSLNQPYALTLTHEQNLSKMYIDTIYEAQQEVVPMNYSATNLLIGKYSNTTLTKGNIYAIRMYNRALMQDEITKNFNIDKLRFGL